MTELIMMVGLPASGKSFVASSFGYEVFSSDKIREELSNVNDQSINEEVFNTLHKRLISCLKSGKSAVYDATNISSKRRRSFINSISNLDVKKVAYVVATPFDECLINNEMRDRKVPYSVINRMYQSFQIPITQEGFDEIVIHYNYQLPIPEYDIDILLKRAKNFDQQNKHHTLSLGDHMSAVANQLLGKDLPRGLYFSSKIHDIGKLKTKTFNSGDTNAHYYNHESVGAYDAMFIVKNANDVIFNEEGEHVQCPYYQSGLVVDVCKYINWHMYPNYIEHESTKQRFIEFVGEEFYSNLMLLHEADKNGH